MISVTPPSGFRDFIQDEARRRLHLINTISAVYESFGFSPIETPALENLNILQGQGGGGEENEKLIFKVMKRGEKLVEALATAQENQVAEFGLRFDLTLPLSRVVAAYRGQIHFPWKVFHIGPVWRAERAQKGRFREFLQCDVDILGAKGIGAEIEVIQAVVQALHRVGASGFDLRINDRRLIQAMAERFGFGGEKLEPFVVLLDKKDKLEIEEILKQMRTLLGSDLSSDLISILRGDLEIGGAKEFFQSAATELEEIMSVLRDLELPLNQIVFDPSLVRGMGYYTGPVFELRHSSAGYSFGGGGRYDKLVGRFSHQEVPACGFSIGFERLLLLLAEKEKSESSLPGVFIPIFDETLRSKTLRLAAKLRHLGIPVSVYPDAAKLKNQFKYASDLRHRWVLIGGPDEWSKGEFKVKDFITGTESPIREEQLGTYLLERSR